MHKKIDLTVSKTNHLKSVNRILEIIIALLFTTWGMLLRFKTFTARDLWIDEFIQMDMTLEPLKPLWLRPNGPKDVTSFPGDYLLTYPFVKGFGFSKFVAIPHVIVTLLGFYLLYLLCRRYCRTALGFLVAFVVYCFNGLLIFHAFEIRPYSVLPTLGLACLYFAGNVIHKNSTEKQGWRYALVVLLFVVTILIVPSPMYPFQFKGRTPQPRKKGSTLACAREKK